ncbi:hypothetical protein BUALT_Bualt19G0100300 [Buddleja alternifolia]|uniref:SCP domain-containing protein n=1 Tax=Buddleja alternifolia TaxID=168488 RepID=A0AAV6W0S7_9LAMI|nr:hypothetical protein BUALT_Bualt19G0100300 [Buddleja alternifolia]
MDSFNTALFISSLVLFSTMATKAFSQTQNSPQDFLDAHNNARAQVGVQPLVWNDTVANYALQYANQRSADCNLQHSGGPYGENLAGGSGELSAVDAVGLWVGEKSFYNYDSNSCVGGECLHYTQRNFRIGDSKSEAADRFPKFVTKTMKRYEELNLKIAKFRLWMRVSKPDSVSLLLLMNQL